MLDRRRARRGYAAVPGQGETDIELGESSGDMVGQEEGVTDGSPPPAAARSGGRTLEEEVDSWDENAVDDWDDGQGDEDDAPLGKGKARSNDAVSGDIGDAKRTD